MINVRAFYKKTGMTKYISHLDTSRLFQRSLKRSGLPVWYTEGFNPHIYVTFAMPLSLGFESVCEIVDFRITESIPLEQIMQQLNLCLPAGIQVHAVTDSLEDLHAITHAVYKITLEGNKGWFCEFDDFLKQDVILVEKKTKKGIKTIDIKSDCNISLLTQTQTGFSFILKVPCGIERNLNPMLLLDAFKEKLIDGEICCHVIKQEMLRQDGNVFA